MPANNPSPLPNAAAEVDLRAWADQVVFYRGATPAGDVTLPAFAGLAAGLFEELAMALNGAGSDSGAYGGKEMTLGATAAAAGGDWAVDIDPATDRLRIQNTGAGAAAFTVTAMSDAFGFPSGVAVASSVIAGGHEAVAPAEWARANLVGALASGDHLSMAQGAATWTWPTGQYRAQCVITLLRGRGVVGDLDDQADGICLEAVDQAVHGTTIRWGLTQQGHTYAAWRTGTVAPITWVDTSFRDYLGFTGLETVQSVGLLDYVVSDHPARACWCPTNPLQDYYPLVNDPSRARRMETGRYAARHRQQIHQVAVELLVDGPAAPRNLLAHVRYRWWPLARVGRPVTLYPNWLERRRRLLPHQVTAGQPAYDLLYTAEGNGRVGRLRCRMATDNDATTRFDFGPDRVEDRVPVTLTLDERED